MATYYVNGTIGDDNTSTAWDPTTPTKTIYAALVTASARYETGVLINIEITDEGIYNEGDLAITKHGTTIIHTASALGKPKLHGVGTAGSAPARAFNLSDVTGTVFQGLEIHSYTSYLAIGAYPFTLSGCFVHSFIDGNCRYAYANLEGTAANPNRILDSVLYFPSNAQSNGIITVDTSPSDGYLEIKNSLITSSHDGYLVRDYGGANVTCSFSTFINRNATTTSTQIQATKVRNCIVSASSANAACGIGSDNHEYNLVHVNGAPFMEHDGTTEGADDTGDKEGDPLFVDATAIGTSSAVAANYKLQSSSPAVAAGTAFDSTTRDISGSLRNQDSKNWSSYSTPPQSNFDGAFTINLYANAAAQYKFGPELTPSGYSMGCFAVEGGGDYNGPLDQATEQVPFSLGPKGPATLRGRLGAYGVSKGGDPSTIIQTSSA